MTNKFAIKVLTELRGYGDKFANIGFDRKEAIDLAIKALELQTCDNNWKFYYDHGYAQAKRDLLCDDAISRADVKKYLSAPDANGDRVIYESDLDLLPPVTPQPKVGKWIFCEGIKGKDNVEKCSCCQSHWKEAVIYRNDTQEYLRLRLKYCPNCGAKMEVDK